MNATNGGRPQLPGPPTVPNWPLGLDSERRADPEHSGWTACRSTWGSVSFPNRLGTTATGLGEMPLLRAERSSASAAAGNGGPALGCRRMRIYAERPARAALQVLVDLTVLVWVFAVTELARATQAAVLALQAPAARLTGAGEAIRTTFDDAASTASGVPFVGDDLAGALGNGTGA